MRYQILTIFPELFENFKQFGLISRALQDNHIRIDTVQLRDFALNAYGQVDDSPYGGGSGMVLRPEPAASAIERAKSRDARAKVVLFTPRGRPFSRELAKQLVEESKKSGGGLILLCCRYEGVDERIAANFADYEISVGDYVLMGGEVPAMVLIEATSRFLPGVLGNPDSAADESFEQGLLEYPQYTKPQVFRGMEVPEVLLSGNHALIAKWREEQARADTMMRRPELLHSESEEQTRATRPPRCARAEVSAALIHYPVLNKEGKVVTSSVTNLDLPDIARSAKTYNLDRYYIVHPTRALRRLMEKICEHWAVGYGFEYNPNRTEALQLLSIVPAFDDVLSDIEARTGKLPKIITTSARRDARTVSYAEMKDILAAAAEPHLILFGTGWGLAPEYMDRADYRLEPICGPGDYNHLSVRAAAAITFDRLFGN